MSWLLNGERDMDQTAARDANPLLPGRRKGRGNGGARRFLGKPESGDHSDRDGGVFTTKDTKSTKGTASRWP
jgi:hypothetical protein